MRFYGSIAVALLFSSASYGLPSPDFLSYIEHERREDDVAWEKIAKLSRGFEVPVKIALTQANEDEAHDVLMEISDPLSSKYGQHFTAAQVEEFFAPPDNAINSIKNWLISGGIAEDRLQVTPNRQWLKLDAKIGELESLLRTEFFFFQNKNSGKTGVACHGYHLPREIAPLVDFFTPGIHVMTIKESSNTAPARLKKRFHRPGEPRMKPLEVPIQELLSQKKAKRCYKAITPDCIHKMYGVPESYTSNPKSKIGFYEIGQLLVQADLDGFFTFVRQKVPNGTHPSLHPIDGAETTTKRKNLGGAEGELDVEMGYGLLNPGDLVYFPTDDNPTAFDLHGRAQFDGLFNNFLDGIDGSYCNYTAFGETGNDPHVDPPYPDPAKGGYKGKLQCGVWPITNVISISYGPREYEYPVNYTRRQCSEFLKLAMQGITTVVSSGDSGVATKYGISDPGCLGKDSDTIFSPQLPAACPYVLTVGATTLPPHRKPDSHHETATISFPSGGGFSNIFPRPNYQSRAVETYLKNYGPNYPYYETKYNRSVGANGGIYNRAGRGYPDVSAVGDNILVVENGVQLTGGTSASAPLWASLLTRINAARLNANKSTVGFVNPVLYQHPEVFYDITVGENPGCQTNGFSASKGWDPVTGLGTPNFPKLLELFMSLK